MDGSAGLSSIAAARAEPSAPPPISGSGGSGKQAVPFAYFIALLEAIVRINQADWPFTKPRLPEDKRFRDALNALGPDAATTLRVATLRAARRQAISDVMRDWVQDLPAGQGPGPHACLPGTTEAVFRLLFPEHDVRRRFGIKESKLIHHLVRALGVGRNDPAARPLFNWADPASAHVHTSGSGCLAIEFERQLKKLGHEDDDESQPIVAEQGAVSSDCLTLQQVDILLDELASWSTFTEESVRSCWTNSVTDTAKQPQQPAKSKAPAKPPGRPKTKLNIINPQQRRPPPFMTVDGRALSLHGIEPGTTTTTPQLTSSFKLLSERPRPEKRRQARSPTQILEFLLGNALPLRSRRFVIQILLRDLDPVLYPLPTDSQSNEAIDAKSALLEYNTRSVAKLSIHEAMLAWHPFMPALWKMRYGSSFAAVGREVERIGWDALASKKVGTANQASASVPSVEPELFTFVQMPKSLKAHTCVGAAEALGHAGVLWAEKKYDGERFQVHVKFPDSGARPEIKIFSKSQRDSTLDRSQTHAIVLAALGRDPALSNHPFHSQLANFTASRSASSAQSSSGGMHHAPFPSRMVQSSVILDAEMVALDATGQPAEFHKIAKVKDRAGMPTAKARSKEEPAPRSGPSVAGEERFRYRLRLAERKREARERRCRGQRSSWTYDSDSDDGLANDAPAATATNISQVTDLSMDGEFHLGLVFFDVLHIDGQSLISRSYEERRAALEAAILPIPLFAQLAERTKVNFGTIEHARDRLARLQQLHGNALTAAHVRAEVEADSQWRAGMRALIEAFALSHVRREEGLMLKAADGCYVGGLPAADVGEHLQEDSDLRGIAGGTGSGRRAAWIKVKADYIRGLGDSVDLAIIGTGWSAKRARELRVGTDAPTTLFLAARLPDRQGRKAYRCWAVAEYGLSRAALVQLAVKLGGQEVETVPFSAKNSRSLPYDIELAVDSEPATLLRQPLVAEVVGGGFSKAAGDDFYMLRWPRVLKIFWPGGEEREAISFAHMQRTAVASVRSLATSVEREEAFQRRVERICGVERLSWMQEEVKPGTGRDISPRGHSRWALASALAVEEEAHKRGAPAAQEQRLSALFQRSFAPQPTFAPSPSPQDNQQFKLASASHSDRPHDRPASPPPSSPLPNAYETDAPTGSSARRVEAGSKEGWGLETLRNLSRPRPSAAAALPMITPPNSSQTAPQAPEPARDALAPASGTPAAPAPTPDDKNAEAKARTPRGCKTTPRLMDAFYLFHSNVPQRIQEVLRPLLLPFLEVHSIEALSAAVEPVLTRAHQSAAANMQLQSDRPRMARARSTENLRRTPEDGQPSALVIMDTSDEEATAFMWRDIRDRIASYRRRLQPSTSAPTGLSIGGLTAARATPAAPTAPSIRPCTSATTSFLSETPIVVLDAGRVDQLAYEQWDCLAECAERGAGAAQGECECCRHIDYVLTCLAVIDPSTKPRGAKRQRVSK
ncbi:hypothetical protein OC844_004856 [Tilletia horrida]|nr:hypothetical protein OC844_004856 [Tilletia horrida]